MKFDLVHGRSDLEARVGKELLEVLDRKVGDTNVFHAAGLGQLLHLGPCVPEVPVGVVLLEITRVGRGRPMLSSPSAGFLPKTLQPCKDELTIR